MLNKKIIYWQKTSTLELLEKSLILNKISIVSADTVLGFLASLTQQSFDQLNTLKGERSDKPYLIVISSLDKIDLFVQYENLTLKLKRFIAHCWPGPVTLIFKAHPQLPPYFTSSTNTVALRCPDHLHLRVLLENFDGLFSTSANKSGKPVPETIEEIDQTLVEKIEYLVLDQPSPRLRLAGEDTQSNNIIPSTILDVSSEDGTIRVVREGAYSIKKLEEYYGSPFTK